MVEENLHVKFIEETPNIAGNGPNWLFDIDALTISRNYKPIVAGNQTNGNAASKDSPNAGFKPSRKEEKKDAEDPKNKSGNPTEGKDSEVPSTKEPKINQEKVGRTARIESFENEGLGDEEDASNQERKITDIDVNKEVTLIDETQGRNDDNLIATTTTVDEFTLAQTLLEIKAAKPKAVTTTATTTITAVSRPKARGVAKDKGKAKMVEPKKPLKKKDQILIDEEITQRLQEELKVELEEEERLATQKEEDANIAEWDNVQAIMRALRRQRWHKKEESSSKRAGDELEQEKTKKQKIDDDEAEIKKHMEIVPNDEVEIDAITLDTKPPIIVDWKIIKEGKMGYFQIIRADGSSRRPEEAYERVLWGDLKVMFEPDVEKKKYPLTPAIITEMLNKKLQADHWNEMCYQLLKLITK
ncbi:hypothetical protein Tco_1449703 [Tanacetum coccineum]